MNVRRMPGEIVVIFRSPHDIWNSGERAGFAPEAAAYLVIKRKVADYFKHQVKNKEPDIPVDEGELTSALKKDNVEVPILPSKSSSRSETKSGTKKKRTRRISKKT